MKPWSLRRSQDESSGRARVLKSMPCAVPLLLAGVLAACGGGGGGHGGAIPATATAIPTGGSGAAIEAAPSDTANELQAAAANAPPPFAYTLRMIVPPPGGSFADEPRAMRVDAKGDFTANAVVDGEIHAFVYHYASNSYEEVGDPSTRSVAADIGNNGFVVGRLGSSRAFAWSQATGRLEIAGPDSFAQTITDSGLVGGDVCNATAGACNAFIWDSATSQLTVYDTFRPGFLPWGMNDAGSMLGVVDPNAPALLKRDGTVTLIHPPPGCGPDFRPIAIDDEGDLFSDAGLVVRADGSVTQIGRDALAPAPGSTLESQATRLVDFNPKGGAVLTHDVVFRDANGNPLLLTVGLHWSAIAGASVIRVASAFHTTPTSVNRDGVVVGRSELPDGPTAFVWTEKSGAFLIEPLVSNMPAGRHLWQASTVGDGGHVLGTLRDFASNQPPLVLLTPVAPAVP